MDDTKSGNVVEQEPVDFFKEYRLQKPPTDAAVQIIRRYVLYGNRTKGVTRDRRADIVRQLQITWNGKRVDFYGQRRGTVKYIKPVMATPSHREPMFEALVRWDEPVNDRGLRTTTVTLNSIKLILGE